MHTVFKLMMLAHWIWRTGRIATECGIRERRSRYWKWLQAHTHTEIFKCILHFVDGTIQNQIRKINTNRLYKHYTKWRALIWEMNQWTLCAVCWSIFCAAHYTKQALCNIKNVEYIWELSGINLIVPKIQSDWQIFQWFVSLISCYFQCCVFAIQYDLCITIQFIFESLVLAFGKIKATA